MRHSKEITSEIKRPDELSPDNADSDSEATSGIGVTAGVLILAGMIGLVAFAAILFVIFQASAGTDSVASANTDTAGEYRGTVFDPPQQLQDFTLTGVDGEPVHLSDFAGRWVLIDFGYTHCPDICPLTLSEYKQIRADLGDQADKVAFVFVSVDGERDTPERMKAYMELRGVDDFVTALTGEETYLKEIGVEYGLFFEKVKDPGTQANYLVNHTAASFLIDPERRLQMIFSMDPEKLSLNPEMVAEEVKKRI